MKTTRTNAAKNLRTVTICIPPRENDRDSVAYYFKASVDGREVVSSFACERPEPRVGSKVRLSK